MSPTKPPKHRQCGAQQVNERLYEQDPDLRGRHREIEDQCQEFISSGYAERVRRQRITLQVVVHVVHKTDEENISDEQVQSQIEALNKDYSATNPDKDGVPAPWTSLVADPNIQFALATKDPDGNATNGITRTQTDKDSFSTDDGVKSEDSGGISPWPVDKYLNLWACNLGGGLLGYAQFPGGPAEHRRRRDPLHRVRHHRRGGRPVQPRPHRDARDRPLPQPAPHLGRHQRLLRLRPGVGHAARARRPTTASRTGRTSPATTGRTATCSWTTWTTSTTPRCSCSPTGQAARMNATLAGPRKKLAGL